MCQLPIFSLSLVIEASAAAQFPSLQGDGSLEGGKGMAETGFSAHPTDDCKLYFQEADLRYEVAQTALRHGLQEQLSSELVGTGP
ncbi:MAG: hypothetical protein K8R59_02010 [Thermoanaerobaculales bacterium]|nr:hypothetical protein [Thermoanaerobaculales bacterium]